MLIDIHDVGHGACAVATFPNSARIMIDAGMRPSEPYWWPSIEYFGQQIDLLVLSNLDEDHVEDLPHVFRNVQVKAHFSNPTVSADALAWMKRENGMRTGVETAHALLRRYGAQLGPLPDLGGNAWARAHWNRYGIDFVDTNNLSVVTLIGYSSFTILFGGDLEEAGWRQLLRSPEFRADLARVKVFVASHHGRENGCCAEVFDFCKPDVVIVSDYEHRHTTQQTAAWYRGRVSGIPDLTVTRSLFEPPATRSVVTTRCDGSLKIKVEDSGRYTIVPERFHAPALPFSLAGLCADPVPSAQGAF